VQPTRLFTEALNARDVDALRALVADDVELRSQSGPSLRGPEGLEAVVKAASDNDLLLARTGPEEVDEAGGGTQVTVPVRMLVGRSDLHGSARFEIRDGRIAGYGVVTPDRG
jgi:ketosteroid isomerase-like protein